MVIGFKVPWYHDVVRRGNLIFWCCISSSAKTKREDERVGFGDDDDDDAMSLPQSVPSITPFCARVDGHRASKDGCTRATQKAGIIIGRRRIIAPRKSLLSSRGDGVRANAVLPVVFGTLTLEGFAPTVEEVFNFENLAVFPFWVAMIGFPKSETTKAVVLSPLTSVACGVIYGYLAYQSFLDPDILEAFSSGAKQDLASLTKGFSHEATVAVGWAHFIAMDLLAGRYIYLDGYKNEFTTRHSLALTLFFGPLGVVSHVITRAIVGLVRGKENSVEDILASALKSK